ncbi:MAG: protein translocase subunit SecF, partial [Clostridia bacterium]
MKKMIDFIKMRKVLFIISAALIVITVILAPFRTQLDINFSGGSIAKYSVSGSLDSINLDDFKKTVEDAVGEEVSITTSADVLSGRSTIIVSISQSNGLNDETTVKMNKAIKEKFSDHDFKSEISNVNATMGREFFIKCIVALVVAAILIIIYIGFRFRKIGGISAGVFSVLALIHDAAIVYLAFLIFGFPLDSNFIAVILTILGYSVNDTIVIYDRIRENQGIYGHKLKIGKLVNLSINQTLGRTICTSAATISSVLVIAVVAL